MEIAKGSYPISILIFKHRIWSTKHFCSTGRKCKQNKDVKSTKNVSGNYVEHSSEDFVQKTFLKNKLNAQSVKSSSDCNNDVNLHPNPDGVQEVSERAGQSEAGACFTTDSWWRGDQDHIYAFMGIVVTSQLNFTKVLYFNNKKSFSILKT